MCEWLLSSPQEASKSATPATPPYLYCKLAPHLLEHPCPSKVRRYSGPKSLVRVCDRSSAHNRSSSLRSTGSRLHLTFLLEDHVGIALQSCSIILNGMQSRGFSGCHGFSVFVKRYPPQGWTYLRWQSDKRRKVRLNSFIVQRIPMRFLQTSGPKTTTRSPTSEARPGGLGAAPPGSPPPS